jgi:hypothetical protein
MSSYLKPGKIRGGEGRGEGEEGGGRRNVAIGTGIRRGYVDQCQQGQRNKNYCWKKTFQVASNEAFDLPSAHICSLIKRREKGRIEEEREKDEGRGE